MLEIILAILHRSMLTRWILGCALFLALLCLSMYFRLETQVAREDNTVIENAEVLYVPSVKMTRILGLGYDQAMADVMWLRTINYFVSHFDSDRKYRWLEHFIDQILELDPKFHDVYHWAGANVLYGRRFTNKNVRRSNRFYLKALERFPDDYEAAYRLGLNFYVELKSKDPDELRAFKEQGLNYLEMAANIPGSPDYLRTLVAAISSKLGKQQVALQYLLDLYIRSTDPAQKEALRLRIKESKAAQGTGGLAEQAELFQTHWKTTFPYVSPGIYALLGEPKTTTWPDHSWRSLIPDIQVQGDDGDAGPEQQRSTP